MVTLWSSSLITDNCWNTKWVSSVFDVICSFFWKEKFQIFLILPSLMYLVLLDCVSMTKANETWTVFGIGNLVHVYELYVPNTVDLHINRIHRFNRTKNDKFKTGKMSGVGRRIIITYIGFSVWIPPYGR